MKIEDYEIGFESYMTNNNGEYKKYYSDESIENMKTDFLAGADWRINSVWHDVDKELPEYNRHVVNEDWFDFTAKDEKDLKRIMNQYPFKRWAYVDDLKPNMEE